MDIDVTIPFWVLAVVPTLVAFVVACFVSSFGVTWGLAFTK